MVRDKFAIKLFLNVCKFASFAILASGIWADRMLVLFGIFFFFFCQQILRMISIWEV